MSDAIEGLKKDVGEVLDQVQKLGDGRGRRDWHLALSIGSLILTLALGVVSAWLKLQADDFDKKLKDQAAQIELQKADLDQRQFDSSYKVAIMHEVFDAISQNTSVRIIGVVAFINSLNPKDESQKTFQSAMLNLLTNPAVQQSMANVLRSSSGTQDQQAQSVARENLDVTRDLAQFRVAQASPTPIEATSAVSPGNKLGWDFDVFWCEASKDKSLPKAQKVYDELVKLQSSKGLGQIRLRMLQAAINQSPGYNVSEYEIRRYPGDANKVQEAQDLKMWLDPVAAPAEFKILDSNTPLPWYLSAFVCL